MVSTLDFLRALLGMPAHHPETFPHWDEATHVSWTDDWTLDEENLRRAPDGPGVLLLVRSNAGDPDEPVWVEASPDVRARLHELTRSPAVQPAALARMLALRGLRFRAATVGDEDSRDGDRRPPSRPTRPSAAPRRHLRGPRRELHGRPSSTRSLRSASTDERAAHRDPHLSSVSSGGGRLQGQAPSQPRVPRLHDARATGGRLPGRGLAERAPGAGRIPRSRSRAPRPWRSSLAVRGRPRRRLGRPHASSPRRPARRHPAGMRAARCAGDRFTRGAPGALSRRRESR